MPAAAATEGRYVPLPPSYGVAGALTLPCGPGRAFVVWELTAELIGRVRDRLGPLAPRCRLVLRCTEGAEEPTDLEVRDWIGQRHLAELSAGARLVVALGYLAEDGTFADLVVAPPVDLPRAAAAEGDVRWVATGAEPQADAAAAVPDALRTREAPVATPFDPASTVSSAGD